MQRFGVSGHNINPLAVVTQMLAHSNKDLETLLQSARAAKLRLLPQRKVQGVCVHKEIRTSTGEIRQLANKTSTVM